MGRCFAYGSNLNLRDLELWCQRLGRPPALMVKPGVPAYLPDHEVVFDYLSSSRKGGVLDLRPSVGKIVPAAELIARFKREYDEAIDPPL